MQKKKYHIDAVLDAECFLDVFEKKKLSIIQQIDNDRYIIYTFKGITSILCIIF